MHRLAAQNSLIEGTFRQIYNGSGKNVTDVGPPLNDLARSVLPWNVARSYGCFDRAELLRYATGGLAYGGARSDTTIVQSVGDPPLSTDDIGVVFENPCWICRGCRRRMDAFLQLERKA